MPSRLLESRGIFLVFINLKEEIDGMIPVMEINGQLNSDTSPELEEYINKLINNKQNLIIMDAKNLEFVSSEGIGVILYMHKKISLTNGFFVICNLSNEISTLYKMLGFDKVFSITETRDEALQIMSKQLEIRDYPERNIMAKDTDQETEKAEIHHDEDIIDETETTEALSAADADGEVEFENSIILECAECKNFIRVKRSGAYMCTDCKREFNVERDQTVIF